MGNEAVVVFQPIGKRVVVEKKTTLLEAAQKAGIGIAAVCGGEFSCGSCRVRILGSPRYLGQPSPSECDLLDDDELNSGIRLACHTQVLDDMEVDIPPESLSQTQRLQIEGIDLHEFHDPVIRSVELQLDDRDELPAPSVWDRLAVCLEKEFGSQGFVPDIELLKNLPVFLEQHNGILKVLLRNRQVISVMTPDSPVLGLAVDLGTTKLATYLVDLESGQTLAKLGSMNPQIAFGEDVMARIAYASTHDDGLQTLHLALRDTLNDLVFRLCEQASRESGNSYQSGQIVDAVFVGNTVMHHTALNIPIRQLGVSPYQATVRSAIDVDAEKLRLTLATATRVHLLPNIAGFVGADHVSMLLAAKQVVSGNTVLFIDIGTNTEISLAKGDQLISCSTASGPAFEGAHIRDGMRAVEGAIEKFSITKKGFRYQTIGQVKPTGICGSGVLDIVSELLRTGIINNRGAFDKPHSGVRNGNKGPELVIVEAEDSGNGKEIIIDRKDISEIQLAKGAIRAGIELLMKEVAVSTEEIDQVVIAGAFGTYLDLENAIRIGMFPDINSARFLQIGNAAGAGARLALLSTGQRSEAGKVAADLKYLELATHPGFSAEFTRAMIF